MSSRNSVSVAAHLKKVLRRMPEAQGPSFFTNGLFRFKTPLGKISLSDVATKRELSTEKIEAAKRCLKVSTLSSLVTLNYVIPVAHHISLVVLR